MFMCIMRWVSAAIEKVLIIKKHYHVSQHALNLKSNLESWRTLWRHV